MPEVTVPEGAVPGVTVPGGMVPAEAAEVTVPEAAVSAGAVPEDAAPASTVPAIAAEVFGAAFPLAQRYAGLLAGPGITRGLLGPREAGRLWERHLLNCAVVAELIPRPSSLVDIGSGAGLPGLVLAMLLPDVQVTLVEPMARRVAFLDECARSLGMSNVTIRRARAEEVSGEFSADVVIARAVAPLGRLATLALPLVRPGGIVLAVKGERAAAEAAEARLALRRLGVTEMTVLQAGTGVVCPAVTVVKLIAGPPGDARSDRRGRSRSAGTSRRSEPRRSHRAGGGGGG